MHSLSISARVVACVCLVALCAGACGSSGSKASTGQSVPSTSATSSSTSATGTSVSGATVAQPGDLGAYSNLPVAQDAAFSSASSFAGSNNPALAAALAAARVTAGYKRSFGNASTLAPSRLSFVRSEVVQVPSASAVNGATAAVTVFWRNSYASGGATVSDSANQTDLGDRGLTFTATYTDGKSWSYVWSKGSTISFLNLLWGVGAANAAATSLAIARAVAAHS